MLTLLYKCVFLIKAVAGEWLQGGLWVPGDSGSEREAACDVVRLPHAPRYSFPEEPGWKPRPFRRTWRMCPWCRRAPALPGGGVAVCLADLPGCWALESPSGGSELRLGFLAPWAPVAGGYPTWRWSPLGLLLDVHLPSWFLPGTSFLNLENSTCPSGPSPVPAIGSAISVCASAPY